MSNHKDYSYLARHQAIPASTESFILLDSSHRIGALIYNSTNKTLYVCFADKASAIEYASLLLPGGQWEIPASYTGTVSGVCAHGVSGKVQVTEW